eukprot:TRINITY_DN5677_c0_g3_i1.p4 TRINITY_DN5677_c0_g3~~TRINITY_DN5677_c0_g3_i1.p4  ORF type:complete len:111 (-),score=4.90 TRINITY_DN5677_c0_g3_i1:399-731(-)
MKNNGYIQQNLTFNSKIPRQKNYQLVIFQVQKYERFNLTDQQLLNAQTTVILLSNLNCCCYQEVKIYQNQFYCLFSPLIFLSYKPPKIKIFFSPPFSFKKLFNLFKLTFS